MNQQHLIQVIPTPIVSGKSDVLTEKHDQIVFRISVNVTKPEVKTAVELLLDVQVADVTTATVKGKIKRFGRTLGRRSNAKRIYINLAVGQESDSEVAAATADKE